MDMSKYRYNAVLDVINTGVKTKVGVSNELINGWSPNNVRRLIIGVDSVVVQFHVVGGNTKYKNLVVPIKFDISKLEESFKDPSYMPVIQALVGERVCSSIEEVIFCMKPRNGMGLPVNEYNFDLVLKGISGNDKIEMLKNRFVRLYALVKCHASVEDIVHFTSSNLKKCEIQLADLCMEDSEFSQKCKVQVVNKNWWNSTFNRGTKYTMDLKDGVLDRHFNKVKGLMLDVNKQKQLEAVDQALIGNSLEKLDKSLRLLDTLVKSSSIFTKMCDTLVDSELSKIVIHGATSISLLSNIDSERGLGVFRDAITKDLLEIAGVRSLINERYSKLVDWYKGTFKELVTSSVSDSKDLVEKSADKITALSIFLYDTVLISTFASLNALLKEYPMYALALAGDLPASTSFAVGKSLKNALVQNNLYEPVVELLSSSTNKDSNIIYDTAYSFRSIVSCFECLNHFFVEDKSKADTWVTRLRQEVN